MEIMKVRARHAIGFIILLIALLSWGCAGMHTATADVTRDRPQNACGTFIRQLDDAVERAGVRDASAFRVRGFPYLRTSRFLVALKDRLKTDRDREDWVRLMRRLDGEARAEEILNLPESAIAGLQPPGGAVRDRKELLARTEACLDELARDDRSDPGWFAAIRRNARAPSEYSPVRRTVGLFPLASIPVNIVTEKVRKRFRAWYDAKLEALPVEGTLRSYAHHAPPDTSAASVAEVLDRAASADPLGIPLLDEDQQRRLAEFFAPVFVQDTAGLYDRMGRITLDGARPDVDPLRPAVYYYVSYALLQGRPVFQLNYVIWTSGRAGRKSPRIERGRLDGLTFRISLDPKGRPFMVDVMNNCGCYHFFVPSRRAVVEARSRPYGLEPFVPQWLPELTQEERFTVRINSGWHQVERLTAAEVPGNAVEYELIPYGALESLPDGEGRRESMFDAKGIARGTGRIEPLVFFSMGIPSIGSMRQRGHHAIELTGHAHFDDPGLFEENFRFRPAGAAIE